MDEKWKLAASAAMDRYACGDDAAFSELYDLLAPRLSSFVSRRVREAARTEDLVQQTFLQMHCARRHFVRGADVTPWAFAIARRLMIDAARKGGREFLGDDVDGAEEPEAPAQFVASDRIVGRREVMRRVEQKLSAVPGAQRTAFELVHFDGLTTAEAAQVLGTTVMAVKLRVHRANEALRAAIGDDVRAELEGPP
jgi:RNA polymerase sigma-70 factor (ECF subfamily)